MMSILGAFFAIVIYLLIQLRIEKRRSRILQAFVGGLFSEVQKLILAVETLGSKEKTPQPDMKSIQEFMFSHVSDFMAEDFTEDQFNKWLKKGQSLFYDSSYANGGFTNLYVSFVEYSITRHTGR